MMRPHVRFRTLALAALALSSLLASACASSTASRSSAPAPTATHAPTATPTPVPPPVNAYLGAGDTVYALDGRTGARLWTYDTGLHSGEGSIADVHVGDGAVFFTNDRDHSLYALDTATGALRWKVKGPELLGFPFNSNLIIQGGVLYITNIGGQVPATIYAVDVQSGSVLWHKDGGGNMVVGDDAVYIASHIHGSDAEPDTDGFINAYNRMDGTLLWQAKGHPFSQMLLGSGVLYATANDVLYAFDAKTGTALWSKQLANSLFAGALVGNTLYLEDSQHMTALDITSQTVIWSFPITFGGLAYGGGTLCVVNQTHLYGLNPTTGAQLWSKQDPTGYATLQYVNGVCYTRAFTSDGSPLSAFDAQTGAVRWTADLKNVYNSFIPTPTAIYALTGAGPGIRGAVVRVLSTADGSQLWQFDANAQFPSNLAVG